MPQFRLLVVLQNPYDKGTLKDGWHPSSWRTEFMSSRTGMRLRDAIPGPGHSGWRVYFTNANPKVGVGVSSHLPPDRAHLRRALGRVAPDFVLACGRCAESSMLALWQGPLIAIPHPAYRLLTDRLLQRCQNCILWWGMLREHPGMQTSHDAARMACASPRLALRQRRGGEELVDLALEPGGEACR